MAGLQRFCKILGGFILSGFYRLELLLEKIDTGYLTGNLLPRSETGNYQPD
ncbi:MAG: hypothetical protein ACYSWZ_26525 [Planctomycetota bacterium]